MRVIKCNVCGKDFNTYDLNEKFGFDFHVGYGSKHDCEHLQADICIECFDRLIDKFIAACKISPIVCEDYLDKQGVDIADCPELLNEILSEETTHE